MRSASPVVAAICVTILAACAREPAPPVESLDGGPDVSKFALTSLKGARDGDRLDVQVVYGDGDGRITVDLRFRVTPPTRLESGAWNGLGGEGRVSERSTTFLGGQSGPPSIGGRFDLLGPDGARRYRINVPLQPLTERL